MTEYVVVHTRSVDCDGPYDMVLLVHKNKPAWQKGRLNLVGGKVEKGETPEDAAVRELKEETGLEPINKPVLCGEILGLDCVIHCFTVDVDEYSARRLRPRDEESETVEWFTWQDAREDHRLIPNLRVIIPLLHMKSKGWKIVDQRTSHEGWHEIGVALRIEVPFVNG